MMKLLYKPFGIIFGIFAGVLSRKLFNGIWGLIDTEEPPTATTRKATWPKVLTAAAVQGATFTATRAAVERAGACWFEHLTGVWPGKKAPKTTDDE
jgi:hypothetical protein